MQVLYMCMGGSTFRAWEDLKLSRCYKDVGYLARQYLCVDYEELRF
jgi:hypothetical protein